jgi:hypothetical protein
MKEKTYQNIYKQFKIVMARPQKKKFMYKKVLGINTERIHAFSTSTSKLTDPDSILNKVKEDYLKMREFKEKFEKDKNEEELSQVKNLIQLNQKKEETIQKVEEEKNPPKDRATFLTTVKDNVQDLLEKQTKIDNELASTIKKKYKKLTTEEEMEINSRFDQKLADNEDKYERKEKEIREECNNVPDILFFQKKIANTASFFKTLTQLRQKEEEAINEVLKTKPDYKESSEQKRLEWKEEIAKKVRDCRQEKQIIETHMASRLEKPSELALSLLDELGPDYTGGDD